MLTAPYADAHNFSHNYKWGLSLGASLQPCDLPVIAKRGVRLVLNGACVQKRAISVESPKPR